MKKLIMLLLMTVLSVAAFAAEIVVTDNGSGTGTTTWTAENTYILDGFVFVNEGQELTIEAGTVIKGMPGAGADASALIVAKGAKIWANGTADNPIIMTAQADDMSVPLNVRGLWGGLIVLGDARINTGAGVGQIEGIPETEPRGAYGGNNDEDSSGSLKYLSIRYGGSDIGAGNEINGVTFGAVGNGTVVENIEVAFNKDDGFEWFGGTVQCKNLVSAFNGDDSFDYDEGYRGDGQFWFSINAADAGNRAGEHDGGTDPEDGNPYAIPTIYNVTYIGSGAANANDDNMTFKIRDNAGCHYVNSIFTDFSTRAIDIEDLESGEDSRARLDAGDLTFTNSIWYGFGDGNTAADLCKNDYEQILFTDEARANLIIDPQMKSIGRTANEETLDPRPQAAAAVTNATAVPRDDFFTEVNYVGAFAPSQKLWTEGWTYLSQYGYTPETFNGINDDVNSIDAHIIAKNYPNPFNPSTQISIELKEADFVTLSVYNNFGQKVKELTRANMAKGVHNFEFDAKEFNSGVYFYKVESAKGFSLTKKMMLVK